MAGWQRQKSPHSTMQRQTYPQAKKQIQLDTFTLTLCNSALYDLTKEKHETYLPTLRNQKKTYPWFFGTHENTRWPRCYQCAPCQGPRQTCGLAHLPNLPMRTDCCAKTVSTMLFTRKASRINVSKYFLCAIVRQTPGLE